MSKPEFTHEEPTTERSAKKLIYQLLCIIVFLAATVAYVETHREEPEIRRVPSMYDFRGHIINMQPVTIDEHCEKED